MMKRAKTIWNKTLIFLGMLCVCTFSIYGKSDLKTLSDYLEHIITNKKQFTDQKEADIASLKKMLAKKDSSPEYIFEINHKIYKEYEKYKLDSAIHYATENMRIVEDLNNQRLKYQAAINLASVYSYSGKLLESDKILNSINPKDLPKDLQIEFYETRSRFYEHYATISNQSSYYKQVEIYKDSLLSLLDPSSFKYRINTAHKYIDIRHTDKAEEILQVLLGEEEVDSPEYALVTHFLGIISGLRGKSEEELKYFTMSAIADVKNSIKENASFQRLATIYYDNGNIAKAFRYSQSGIEDAIFSGVQFRATQMSEFYSIINASYQLKEAGTNRKLKTFIVLISVLSVFLILLVLYVYKQMKRLARVKEEVSLANGKLKELNTQLNDRNMLINQTNGQLSEANQVKEQYIAQFFNLCSTYIDKMEDFRKGLYKLAINRQYEDLVKRLKSTSAVDMELEDLYKQFDSIFLALYPTFVADFNALLDKDEQIQLKADDLMNRELRIYALLRLGITDSVKISGFLRCSMSTIYNYRTKMRNKAYNREEFEERVMKIGEMEETE